VDKIAKNAIIVNIEESKNIEIRLTVSTLSAKGVLNDKFELTPKYCIIS
jgi:hypothetical protein